MRDPVGLHVSVPPGFPEQEIAVGIERAAAVMRSIPGKPFPGVDFLQARRSGAVDQQVGVMHDTRLAGADLDSSDPMPRARLGVKMTFQYMSRPEAGNSMGFFASNTRSGVPSCHPPGNSGGALPRRLRLRERLNLPKSQWSRSQRQSAGARPPELAITGLGQPGRHVATTGRGRDLGASLLDVFIGE